jgi:hypothetical protein
VDLEGLPPFLSIPEFGALFGWGESQSYVMVRRLGVAVRLSPRRLVVPRGVVEAMSTAPIERARELGREEAWPEVQAKTQREPWAAQAAAPIDLSSSDIPRRE